MSYIGCWYIGNSNYMEIKVCSKCEVSKPISEFSLRDKGRYISSHCKRCKNDSQNIRRKGILIARKEVRMESELNSLIKRYIGWEIGSYVVKRYIGRYKVGHQQYERYYFEKECKFCGVLSKDTPGKMDSYVKNPPKCNLCNETVNIHTQEKKCNHCQIWYPATTEYFPQCKTRRFGIHYYCRTCHRSENQKHRSKPINKKKEYEQKKHRMNTDPLFKLICSIRSNIKAYIIRVQPTRQKKKAKTPVILGCDYFQFREYIEKQFTEGMSWDNYGKWHLEHIIPASYGKNEDEVIELCHHVNYRPMWGSENLSKGNKLMIDELSPIIKKQYKKYINRYIDSDLVRRTTKITRV